MTREEAAPYLRRIFAAGDAGLLPSEFAEGMGLSVEAAFLILEGLYRQRLLARVPNAKGKGYLVRIPKRSDDRDGFLYEASGDPVVRAKKPQGRRGPKRGDPPRVDQIPLF